MDIFQDLNITKTFSNQLIINQSVDIDGQSLHLIAINKLESHHRLWLITSKDLYTHEELPGPKSRRKNMIEGILRKKPVNLKTIEIQGIAYDLNDGRYFYPEFDQVAESIFDYFKAFIPSKYTKNNSCIQCITITSEFTYIPEQELNLYISTRDKTCRHLVNQQVQLSFDESRQISITHPGSGEKLPLYLDKLTSYDMREKYNEILTSDKFSQMSENQRTIYYEEALKRIDEIYSKDEIMIIVPFEFTNEFFLEIYDSKELDSNERRNSSIGIGFHSDGEKGSNGMVIRYAYIGIRDLKDLSPIDVDILSISKMEKGRRIKVKNIL